MSPATPHPSVSQTIPCIPKASTTSGETPMTSGHRPAARIAITAILAYQALSVAAIIANPQWNSTCSARSGVSARTNDVEARKARRRLG
jgi:hypothetical protein